MSTQSQHVERREGWVSTMDIYRKGDAFDPDDYVRMREVLPGDITITRDELRAAWLRVFKVTFEGGPYFNKLAAELWPEGSNGEETGEKPPWPKGVLR